jgi:hypothetical protein
MTSSLVEMGYSLNAPLSAEGYRALIRELQATSAIQSGLRDIEYAGQLYRLAYLLQSLNLPATADVESVRTMYTLMAALLERANLIVKEIKVRHFDPYKSFISLYARKGGDRRILVELTKGPISGSDLNRALGPVASLGAECAIEWGLAERYAVSNEYALTPVGYVIAAIVTNMDPIPES